MEKIKTRSEIEEQYKWDLKLIYKNNNELDEDIEKYNDLTNQVVTYKGKILENSQNFYNFYQLYEKIERLGEKIYVYAHMKCDEDTIETKNQAIKMKVDKVIEESQEKTSFINAEILNVDYEKILLFLEENTNLKKYSLDLEKTFRYKNHILSQEIEEVITKASNAMGAGAKVFYNLNNSDIKYGEVINENNDSIELTNSNYIQFMNSKNREVRKRAFEVMYNYWKNIKNTVASTLSGTIKENFFMSKIRNFESPLQSSLYSDDIDTKVYFNLIETVHKNLDKIYDYMDVRKKILKIDETHMYDIYIDLINDHDNEITYIDGTNIIIDALKPLGDNYIEDLRKAFDEKWIDIYPNVGKKSGAYSWGCYDSLPYLLLNYNNDVDSVSTMAHELGHSMHTYYSNKNQEYIYSNYPIFLAEIASTVNEILLNDYLYRNSKTKEEKILYLTEFLDKIRTTLYKQTMFAEFEMIIHDKENSNIPLTEQELSNTYYDLNKLYYGNNVISDDYIRYEWEKVSHFYTSFYTYKYATGISAAVSIASDILNNKEGIKEKYIEFLSSGGNGYPLDILKKVGVDMTNPEPIEKAINMFEQKLEELKKLYNL